MRINIIKFVCLLGTVLVINGGYAAESANLSENAMQISSDHIKQNKSQLVYSGNVLLIQGGVVMRADKAIANITESSTSSVTLSCNPATFEQVLTTGDDITVEATTLQYDVARGDITMTGGSSQISIENKAKGKKIIYNVNTHDFKL